MQSKQNVADLSLEALKRLAAESANMSVDQLTMLSCSEELIARGLLTDAQAVLVSVLQVDRACGKAYELLAGAFESLGAWRRAINAWEALLAIDPDNVRALNRLGALHLRCGDSSSARWAFERAAVLAPHEAEPFVGSALAMLALEDFASLVGARDKLLARFPHSAHAHLIDGHVCKIRGQKDDAVSAYKRALRIDPELTNALFNLTELEPADPDSLLARKLKALCLASPSHEDRAHVNFALARVYDAANRFEEAFACYEEGNRASLEIMSSQGIRYDPNVAFTSAQRTIDSFDATSFRNAIRPLPIDLTMIFIVGLPRSGTSLIEQVLSCHSEVTGGGELPMMQECLSEFEKHRTALDMDGPVNLAEANVAKHVIALRERYVDALFARGLESKFVTDKLPGNFAALGLARLMFPDAIVVHCSRRPIAVCWSLYCAYFGTHSPYYNSFEGLAHYHGIYRRLMDYWRRVLDPPMIEMDYESIVTQPETEIRRLVAGCGLPWEPSCLAFYEAERPVFTASQMQVRRPIYSSSLDRWERYRPWLGPLIEALQ